MMQGRFEITAGLGFRRMVRRKLIAARGIRWDEDRGFLDSLFVVSGPANEVHALHRLFRRFAK